MQIISIIKNSAFRYIRQDGPALSEPFHIGSFITMTAEDYDTDVYFHFQMIHRQKLRQDT